ncbi:hypothetical protein EVAR_92205_1 [Eumeta japonica]|uniref:Uncharacterized protein n=1 Tax=Eumeta variegata TaxID=151549 RepID=A0A4C1TNF8_EUMVA|nr:hypothetical protein EVAR_92205_1 [Eumeta japonica]
MRDLKSGRDQVPATRRVARTAWPRVHCLRVSYSKKLFTPNESIGLSKFLVVGPGLVGGDQRPSSSLDDDVLHRRLNVVSEALSDRIRFNLRTHRSIRRDRYRTHYSPSSKATQRSTLKSVKSGDCR